MKNKENRKRKKVRRNQKKTTRKGGSGFGIVINRLRHLQYDVRQFTADFWPSPFCPPVLDLADFQAKKRNRFGIYGLMQHHGLNGRLHLFTGLFSDLAPRICPNSGNQKRWRQTGSRQSTPPVDDMNPMRKFSIDSASHTDMQNPAEFSPKEKPIRNFSIDPTSSIQIALWTPFLRTPFPRLLILFRSERVGFLPGGSFRKGVRVSIGVPGRGVWGWVEGVVGGGFLWKMREKGKGVGRLGGGVGTGKGTGKSMRKLCRNYPLASTLLFQPQTLPYSRGRRLSGSWRGQF